MSRYQECLRHARARAMELRALAEAGKLNGWNIENLMKGYLDLSAFAPDERAVLLRDALGDDWEEWRAHDYRVGRPAR